jgi:hypothetical protein
MKALNYPRAKNNVTLRKLVEKNQCFSGNAIQIKAQYLAYFLQKGNPATITPIGLGQTTIDFLKARYNSPAKKYDLDWISQLRDNHGLAFCPMCGSSNVRTLEHYLPKASYPEFYVFSLNLIPSCSTCNQKRGNLANAPGVLEPLLHPYFDGNILNLHFLEIQINPPYEAPSFIPNLNNQLPNIMHSRAQRHIKKSIDTVAFKDWMTNQWVEWKQKARREPDLNSLINTISTNLSDHISASGPNTWTAAFLRGLHNDHIAADWLRLNP